MTDAEYVLHARLRALTHDLRAESHIGEGDMVVGVNPTTCEPVIFKPNETAKVMR